MKTATATIAAALSLLAKTSLASEEHAIPSIITSQAPGYQPSASTVPGSPPKVTTIRLTSECSPKYTVRTSTVPGPHSVTSYYVAWTEAGQVSSATLSEYPLFSQAPSCSAAPTASAVPPYSPVHSVPPYSPAHSVPPYSPVQSASTTLGHVPIYTPILSSVGPYSGSASTAHPSKTVPGHSAPSVYTTLVAQEPSETVTGTKGPYTGPVITPVTFAETGFVTSIRN